MPDSSAVLALFILSACFLQTQAALNDCQKSIVMQATNVYESSHVWFPFDSCEDIHDGRGYTVGIVGFTTATHDAYTVISEYASSPNQTNEFAPYMDRLKSLNDTGSASTSGLSGFCSAWYTACSNVAFRTTQVDQMEKMYWVPSQDLADKYNLSLAAARGQLYDTAIQHGTTAGDPDGLYAIASRALSSVDTTASDYETAFLNAFFNERLKVLCNPSEKSTKSAWCASTSRVKSYQYLANSSQANFTGSESNGVQFLDNDEKVMNISCDPDLFTKYIPGPLPSNGGLSVGAIVGIVFGLVISLVLAGIIAWIWYCHRTFSGRRRKVLGLEFRF